MGPAPLPPRKQSGRSGPRRGSVRPRSPGSAAAGRERPPRRSPRFREAPSRASARSPLPRLRFYRWPRFGVGGDSRQVTVSRLSRFAATVYGPLLGRLFRPRLDYLLGRPAGQFLQMVEAVREAPDTEGQRAQFDDQIVQFAARQKGPHDVPAGPILLGVVTEDL